MEESAKLTVPIEVCTGPNCSAGGAAILEIEELILEDGTGRFEIVKGGCRDLCTMGPNVHCQSTHFPRIKSPEDCHQFAVQAGMQVSPPSERSVDGLVKFSTVGSMMLKKANRLRWKVLRDVGSRCCTQTRNAVGRHKIAEWQRLLEEAQQVEVNAVSALGYTTEGANRAMRRLKRLEQLISSRVDNMKAK
jgi:hypothetical protein